MARRTRVRRAPRRRRPCAAERPRASTGHRGWSDAAAGRASRHGRGLGRWCPAAARARRWTASSAAAPTTWPAGSPPRWSPRPRRRRPAARRRPAPRVRRRRGVRLSSAWRSSSPRSMPTPGHPSIRGRAPTPPIVLEPTDLGVTLAHRGFAWYRVEYEGLAVPRVAARTRRTTRSTRALDGLLALRAARRPSSAPRPRHPLLGAGSVRVADGRRWHRCRDGRRPLRPRRRTPHPARRTRPGRGARARARSRRGRRASSSLGGAAGDGGRPRRRRSPDAVLAGPRAASAGAPAVRRGDPWWTDAGLIADGGDPRGARRPAPAAGPTPTRSGSRSRRSQRSSTCWRRSSAPSATRMDSRTEGASP